MTFKISQIHNASVWNIYKMRERIDMNPVYQRESDIWGEDKRQLLIDTIINGFDVPKIYLHKIPSPKEINGKLIEYAVIDGKQRLSTMWDFIQGKFNLASDFTHVKESTVAAANFTYADLGKEYPDTKTDFDSYNLDIITIETDEVEIIEDMFSRLNEAVPLNAAEKRNARPGPLPAAVRALCTNTFFTEKVPFDNSRYRHYDLAAKMLLFASRDQVTDTKKAYLDRFFSEHAKSSADHVDHFRLKAISCLDNMAKVFINGDYLLRSVGMISLYFLLFMKAEEKGLLPKLNRNLFEGLEKDRRNNRLLAEQDIAKADYRLLEFDRFNQSPNDGIALRFRLYVIDQTLLSGALDIEPT